MDLIKEVVIGFVRERLKEYPASYLFPDSLAYKLKLEKSQIVEVLEELVSKKEIVKRYSYECVREKLQIDESKEPLDRVYCWHCDKRHSLEKETLARDIVFRGKKKKRG